MIVLNASKLPVCLDWLLSIALSTMFITSCLKPLLSIIDPRPHCRQSIEKKGLRWCYVWLLWLLGVHCQESFILDLLASYQGNDC